jgi:GntR family transcriptional regulator
MSAGIIKLTYDASRPIRFSHEMASQEIPHRFEVVKKDIINADPKVRKFLNLKKDRKVIRLTLVLYANHEPVIIERNFFPYDEFKELYHMKIDVPPLQLTAEKFNMPVKQVTQYISATVAGKSEQRLFRITYPIPCIYLEWICHNGKGAPFSVSLCHYRSDVFKFKIPTSELVKADSP